MKVKLEKKKKASFLIEREGEKSQKSVFVVCSKNDDDDDGVLPVC